MSERIDALNETTRMGEFEIIERLRPKFGSNKFIVIPSEIGRAHV